MWCDLWEGVTVRMKNIILLLLNIKCHDFTKREDVKTQRQLYKCHPIILVGWSSIQPTLSYKICRSIFILKMTNSSKTLEKHQHLVTLSFISCVSPSCVFLLVLVFASSFSSGTVCSSVCVCRLANTSIVYLVGTIYQSEKEKHSVKSFFFFHSAGLEIKQPSCCHFYILPVAFSGLVWACVSAQPKQQNSSISFVGLCFCLCLYVYVFFSK